MSKFWTPEVKAAIRRQPIVCLAIVGGYAAWYGLFIILTLLIGGVLVIANKNDEWVSWWLP